MYLVLFLFNVFFYRHVATAFCCQTKSKSSLDRNEWLSDVGTLDELHMQYLKKTILSNMRINKVPEEAKRWRRTRSIEALLEQSPSIIDDFNENDENIRYYSLKVVGLQTTSKYIFTFSLSIFVINFETEKPISPTISLFCAVFFNVLDVTTDVTKLVLSFVPENMF